MAKLTDIEGIGDSTAAKLKSAGVGNTDALLDSCCEPRGRARISEATGIGEKRLLRYTNHADLMRIGGIGGEFSELLEAAGVDSVPELAQRNPDNLASKLQDVNGKKRLVRRVPTAKVVGEWIQEAKNAGRRVTH